MGLIEKWEWANGYRRKRCRSFLWRVRAAVKRVAGCKNFCVKRQTLLQQQKKKQLCSKFQYDPWSYALNFDDGSKNFGGKVGFGNAIGGGGSGSGSGSGDAVLVYVVWVKTT